MARFDRAHQLIYPHHPAFTIELVEYGTGLTIPLDTRPIATNPVLQLLGITQVWYDTNNPISAPNCP